MFDSHTINVWVLVHVFFNRVYNPNWFHTTVIHAHAVHAHTEFIIYFDAATVSHIQSSDTLMFSTEFLAPFDFKNISGTTLLVKFYIFSSTTLFLQSSQRHHATLYYCRSYIHAWFIYQNCQKFVWITCMLWIIYYLLFKRLFYQLSLSNGFLCEYLTNWTTQTIKTSHNLINLFQTRKQCPYQPILKYLFQSLICWVDDFFHSPLSPGFYQFTQSLVCKQHWTIQL
jgi:hypothetical protein